MIINMVPKINNMILDIIMLFGGLFLTVVDLYFYISSGFGAGPRDSLMVALTRKTCLTIGLCQAIIEIMVVAKRVDTWWNGRYKNRHETLNNTWKILNKNKK